MRLTAETANTYFMYCITVLSFHLAPSLKLASWAFFLFYSYSINWLGLIYFNFADRFDFNYLTDIISTAYNDFTRSTPHLPVTFTFIWNYKGHRYAHLRAITEKGSYEGPAFWSCDDTPPPLILLQ